MGRLIGHLFPRPRRLRQVALDLERGRHLVSRDRQRCGLLLLLLGRGAERLHELRDERQLVPAAAAAAAAPAAPAAARGVVPRRRREVLHLAGRSRRLMVSALVGLVVPGYRRPARCGIKGEGGVTLML